MRYRTIAILLALIFSASIADGQSVRVTIVHVNDVYQFMPVDGGARGGLGRVMTIRKHIAAENPNTIMTLGGDTVSPSVETRTYKGAQMIDAWNAVGLDLAVFGNHEFDIKTAEILSRIKESKFSWLGANVVDVASGKTFADTPPYIIRDFGGAKVGFIGLLLPEAKQTSSMDATVTVTDFCAVAAKYVPEMRKAGAMAVVGLTHLSMAQDKTLSGCAKFDLILGGHEHSILQSSANGTPILKMTSDAREAGRFDLTFNLKTKTLEGIDWEVIPVTDKIADDPGFGAVVSKYRELLDKLAVPVGSTAVTLDGLSISNRSKETNIGNFIADAYRGAVGADVALINGGSIRADLTYNPGVLTVRDVLSLLPFNNPIVKIELSGRTLRQALEHSVARSGVGEDSEPGRFPQISGMSFKFDTSKPVGQRIIEIQVGGKAVDENRTYTLATSDFLVSRGGDGYTMFKEGKVLLSADSGPKDSDALEKAIRNSPGGRISPSLEERMVKVK